MIFSYLSDMMESNPYFLHSLIFLAFLPELMNLLLSSQIFKLKIHSWLSSFLLLSYSSSGPLQLQLPHIYVNIFIYFYPMVFTLSEATTISCLVPRRQHCFHQYLFL